MGLKILDGTPTAISKYLREEERKGIVDDLENIKAKLIGLNAFLEGHTEFNVKDILEDMENLTQKVRKE